jgi:hypothetical protein
MDRRSALLADLNIATARGLEIGPLTAAVVSKADGKVEYIDHLSTEELKKKYANDQSTAPASRGLTSTTLFRARSSVFCMEPLGLRVTLPDASM